MSICGHLPLRRPLAIGCRDLRPPRWIADRRQRRRTEPLTPLWSGWVNVAGSAFDLQSQWSDIKAKVTFRLYLASPIIISWYHVSTSTVGSKSWESALSLRRCRIEDLPTFVGPAKTILTCLMFIFWSFLTKYKLVASDSLWIWSICNLMLKYHQKQAKCCRGLLDRLYSNMDMFS